MLNSVASVTSAAMLNYRDYTASAQQHGFVQLMSYDYAYHLLHPTNTESNALCWIGWDRSRHLLLRVLSLADVTIVSGDSSESVVGCAEIFGIAEPVHGSHELVRAALVSQRGCSPFPEDSPSPFAFSYRLNRDGLSTLDSQLSWLTANCGFAAWKRDTLPLFDLRDYSERSRAASLSTRETIRTRRNDILTGITQLEVDYTEEQFSLIRIPVMA